jgi:hypothetical protein
MKTMILIYHIIYIYIYIYIYVTRRPLNDFKICLFKKRLFVVESIMAMDFAIFILLFIFFVVSCTTSNC